MNTLTTPAQVALGLVCTLLLGAIGFEAAAPLPEPVLPAPETSTGPIAPVPLPVFHPPPSENFDEINARPVFDRARAPIAADTSTAIGTFSGSSTSPPAVSLVGIIIDGDRRLAMIRSPLSPAATSVSLGDMIEGWKVARIDSDRIVLHSGSDNAEIRLSQNRSPNAGGGLNPPVPGFGANPGAAMGTSPGAVPGNGPVASPPPDRPPH